MQVSTLGRARDRLTVSPTTGTPPPPEPSSEQVKCDTLNTPLNTHTRRDDDYDESD